MMDPCKLNAAIAVITNHFYCKLKRDDFINLGVLLSLLSKSMLSMAALEGLLDWEDGKPKSRKVCKPKEEKKDDKKE